MPWDGDQFALRVRVAMAERGLKPKQLASESGLSREQLGRILRGRRTAPSRPELDAIARALRVPLDQLVQDGEATPPDGRAALPEDPLDRFDAALSELAEGVFEVAKREHALDARLAEIESALRREGLM